MQKVEINYARHMLQGNMEPGKKSSKEPAYIILRISSKGLGKNVFLKSSKELDKRVCKKGGRN